jgi:hypothetical protein
MSILVSIGSDPKDIDNLTLARDLAKFVSSLLKAEDHTVLFADSNYSQKQIEDLRVWLDNILLILFNGGTIEDLGSDTLVINR